MSILTDAMSKKITFSQAAAEIGVWGQKLVAKDPALTAAVGQVMSDAKQAASNAVMLADTSLAAYITPAASALEASLDAILAKATGGISVPFNPLINDGIDTIAKTIKAEADAWALKAKASLSSQQG